MENEIFSRLAQLGFTPVSDAVCVGTWNNYAVELQRFGGRLYYVYVAIRIPKADSTLRKGCKSALKATGVKRASIERIMPNYLLASYGFGKDDDALTGFRAFMDALTAALTRHGVGPANTCALTGAPNPDSLCLVLNNTYAGYQPVVGAAVRQGDYELQARVEENESSGSYVTGFVGALLGALLAVAVNVLVLVFTDMMFSVLFALVPIAAMFGYKLFKGKTDRASVAVIVLLCLLAIPLMVYLTVVVTVVREYAVPLGDALRAAAEIIVDPAFLSEASRDIIMMLVFMALGLFIAWRFIRNQLNSTQTQTSRLQVETMRPNPAYAAAPAAVENPASDAE